MVTSIQEFQGAQARNTIICDKDHKISSENFRNSILRTMSYAIIILDKDNNKLSSSGAIEDTNLHSYIYPDGKAPECHLYHNEYKHDISALTLAILDKYKLLDQDESIAIITYSKISKNINREANTKKLLSLTFQEIKDQSRLENQKLYEDDKRNISRNYVNMSWSYYDINYNTKEKLKDLSNKPRHINYINIDIDPFYENVPVWKNLVN